MKYLKSLVAGLILIVSLNTSAQNITQVVRGQIIEKQTQASLPGATVLIVGSYPAITTITDYNGYFKLENIPVGRVSIQISYIGFNTIILNNLSLLSGKELLLNIEMEEKIQELDEVIITARNKEETINKMASISARTFSVEESQRYAGARNDKTSKSGC